MLCFFTDFTQLMYCLDFFILLDIPFDELSAMLLRASLTSSDLPVVCVVLDSLAFGAWHLCSGSWMFR